MLTWDAIPGWFSWPETYQAAVDAAPQAGARFVELGVFCGRSACFMASAIRASGKSIAFDAVDNYSRAFGLKGDATRSFIEACGFTDLINLRVMHQMEAVSTYADDSLDFVFVDSDHSYEATRECLAAYRRKVKSGGVLAGDDYTAKRFPGVVRAVDEELPARTLTGSVFVWVKP